MFVPFWEVARLQAEEGKPYKLVEFHGRSMSHLFREHVKPEVKHFARTTVRPAAILASDTRRRLSNARATHREQRRP